MWRRPNIVCIIADELIISDDHSINAVGAGQGRQVRRLKRAESIPEDRVGDRQNDSTTKNRSNKPLFYFPFLVKVPASPNDVIDSSLPNLYHTLNNLDLGMADTVIGLHPAPKQPLGSRSEGAEYDTMECLDLISGPGGNIVQCNI